MLHLTPGKIRVPSPLRGGGLGWGGPIQAQYSQDPFSPSHPHSRLPHCSHFPHDPPKKVVIPFDFESSFDDGEYGLKLWAT